MKKHLLILFTICTFGLTSAHGETIKVTVIHITGLSQVFEVEMVAA